MNTTLLETTAHALVTPGKGILAADESAGTCERRFTAVGVESTEENRRKYRQILVTSPAIRDRLSGIIFFEETLWQKTDDGRLFTDVLAENGVLPGIKLDQGLQDLPGFPGEKVSAGLDSLATRIEPFAKAGAKFAKWRSVIAIGEGIPTQTCIDANSYVLARYARICQEFDVVPIVEPEVLFDGTHTIERCEEVTANVYDSVFAAMSRYRVHLPGAVLKTGMVLPGKDSGAEMDHAAVAVATVRTLVRHVPKELGGVVFLSGGQTPKDAFTNLNRIAQLGPHPWGVTFSYSRGIQDPVLKTWAKNTADPTAASDIYARMLQIASDSRKGILDESMDIDAFVSRSQDL